MAIDSLQDLAVVELRAEHLSDCERIVDAAEVFRGSGLRGSRVVRDLAPALPEPLDITLLATLRGVPAAFCWLVRDGAFGRSGYLRFLAVDDSVGRRGVGSALLGAAERLCQSDVFLLVTADNTAARAFYERNGYRQVGTVPGYLRAGSDECLYWKTARLADDR